MSMDDVLQTMQRFEQELATFNDRLRTSFADLDQHHEQISGLWQDNMRRQYDARWSALEAHIQRYVAVDGGHYIEALREKLNAINGYLYGS